MAGTGNTFDCLREANSSEIFTGLKKSIAEAPERNAFDPTFDGPDGLFPDIASNLINAGHFARLPFIAGTNLDEGSYTVNIRFNIFLKILLLVLGTLFTDRSNPLTSDDIEGIIIANFSPPLVNPTVLQDAAQTLLELYPDIPALGSPYNTGNETFDLPTGYKRAAAIVELIFHNLLSLLTKVRNQRGDLSFESQRRSWIQAASGAGVKTYGYRFTQPQPNGDPALGG